MGIGPSTKETTLHHFRDPIIDLLEKDADFQPAGVVVAGIAATAAEKDYISGRLATWLLALEPDGVLVSMDSWGNSHIDFNLLLDHLAAAGIASVGLCFQGEQAQPVTGRRCAVPVVDVNKSPSGRETEILAENNITPEDARKALAFLKLLLKKSR